MEEEPPKEPNALDMSLDQLIRQKGHRQRDGQGRSGRGRGRYDRGGIPGAGPGVQKATAFDYKNRRRSDGCELSYAFVTAKG